MLTKGKSRGENKAVVKCFRVHFRLQGPADQISISGLLDSVCGLYTVRPAHPQFTLRYHWSTHYPRVAHNSPMTESIASWDTQLNAAITAAHDRPGYTHATLATVRGPDSEELKGRPSCRTVNVRQFEKRSLYFVSDTRSGKANDVTKGSSTFAELCWYFEEVKKQFRLNGKLVLHRNDTVVLEHWTQLPPFQRTWWSWPHPGTPRGAPGEFQVPVPENPPQYFCICELQPDHVDILDLTEAPFVREAHVTKNILWDGKEALWTAQMLNP